MLVRNAEAQLRWLPHQRMPPPAAKDTNLALDFTAWKLGGDTEFHAKSALLSYILKKLQLVAVIEPLPSATATRRRCDNLTNIFLVWDDFYSSCKHLSPTLLTKSAPNCCGLYTRQLMCFKPLNDTSLL